ncbi:glycosyltransferase family 4 protein [Pseudorhodoferax sp. Leaf274]|uniref:glycosyltransferase family 4 protein n=1 Tax=Pseudorhodoferax sp. Leaf274 TaxID=1736318 RepID=UPI0007030A5C|nr:glycosyltransferase family 4 protein [Pseudorhodoferax sp. Leaf274]KQP39782.1 hypothetical protein ASF44_08635 [Pseudorhodoferax sp. Leaf274]
MRYPDDQGFVWKTIGHTRDLVAGHLLQFKCYVAFPKLTGNSAHRFDFLEPVELDCYDMADGAKAKLRDFVVGHDVVAIVYMSALPSTLDMDFLRRSGLRSINTENDSFDHARRDPWATKFAKFLVRRVLRRQLHDLHIANAVSQGEWLRAYAQIPADRLVVIPDGVDCTHFVPRSASTPSVLDPRYRWVVCAGQARSEKRIEWVIRAASRIIESGAFPDVAFVYVGSGGMLPAWKELAATSGLADRFHFAGHHADLRPYYQSAVLMVHASELESFGLVIVEAMACGLPVIACRAAGPSETVVDGVTGCLVDVDDEQGFNDAIDRYLARPDLAQEHGSAGRARAMQKYSIFRQAADIAAAIEDTLSKRRATS